MWTNLMCFCYADNLKVFTIVSIKFFGENSLNSSLKLALKLRICVRFATIFYVRCHLSDISLFLVDIMCSFG